MTEQSSELRPGQVLCRVTQLDKDTLEITCERKVRVQALIDEVYKRLNLDESEKEYFSLFYEGRPYAVKGREAPEDAKLEKIFLDPAKLAKKQIPNGATSSIWEIKFGVKFYVTDPATTLRSDSTRSLFCWQLCDDIRSNRVLVDRESAMRLTALMLQAHLGDYDPAEHHSSYCFQYPQFVLLPQHLQVQFVHLPQHLPQHIQPSNYEEQIAALHQSKIGYNPEQAESEFLEIAAKLSRYGMHQFAVENMAVVMGNCSRGIWVFQDNEERCYEWPNISDISYKSSYKSHRVYIIYNELDGTVSRNKFHCTDKRNAKLIWRNAVDQHTFFRLLQVEQPRKVSVMLGLSRRPSVRKTIKQLLAERDLSNTTSPTRSTRVIVPLPQPHPPPNPTPQPCLSTNPTPQPTVINIDKKGDSWVLLDEPPAPVSRSPGDANKFEEQQVVVNFSSIDKLSEEEKSKYVITWQDGGYKIKGVQTGHSPQDSSYELHTVKEDANLTTTMVSVLIDLKKQRDPAGPPLEIFNSARLPVVKKICALDDVVDSVAVATVMEPEDGGAVSSGVVTQRSISKAYDIERLHDEASYEAQQVHLFLQREAEIFRSAAQPSFQIMVQ